MSGEAGYTIRVVALCLVVCAFFLSLGWMSHSAGPECPAQVEKPQ